MWALSTDRSCWRTCFDWCSSPICRAALNPSITSSPSPRQAIYSISRIWIIKRKARGQTLLHAHWLQKERDEEGAGRFFATSAGDETAARLGRSYLMETTGGKNSSFPNHKNNFLFIAFFSGSSYWIKSVVICLFFIYGKNTWALPS